MRLVALSPAQESAAIHVLPHSNDWPQFQYQGQAIMLPSPVLYQCDALHCSASTPIMHVDGDDTRYVWQLAPTHCLASDQCGIDPTHRYAAAGYPSAGILLAVHRFSLVVVALIQHLGEGVFQCTC